MTAGMLDHSSLAQIIVLRILCSGQSASTAADLKDDLYNFVSHRLSQGEWRQALAKTLDDLICAGAMEQSDKGRLSITAQGEKTALAFLGMSRFPSKDWKDIKTMFLTAKALDLQSRAPKTLKALKSADGLRSAIVKKYYNLAIKTEIPSPSQVRNALAKVMIAETSDQAEKKKFKMMSRLPEKLALFLASRKLRRPREVESLNELLTLLAAEALGAMRSDPASLRLHLLRKLVTRINDTADKIVVKDLKEALKKQAAVAQAKQPPKSTKAKTKAGAKTTSAKTSAETSSQLALNLKLKPKTPKVLLKKKAKPIDLEGFSEIVQSVARSHATGWPGNRRAYISHVWKEVTVQKPDLGLDEDGFKTLLADAHRAGHLTLAIADLRDKTSIADIQDSVTRYRNTEWHFIRVED